MHFGRMRTQRKSPNVLRRRRPIRARRFSKHGGKKECAMFQYSSSIFHDSHDVRYRSPLGACKTGEYIKLRLHTGQAAVRSVQLAIFSEHGKSEYNMNGHKGWWEEIVQMPSEPGVLWYYFALSLMDGTIAYYGCPSGRTSGIGALYSANPLSFQITVYDSNFETPDFFKKAILYQIFPDRFCRGRDEAQAKAAIRYHQSMGRRAYLHGSFEEAPLYLPLPGEPYYAPCDYFGGDLKGIEQSLPQLAELGVTVLYLNPIFEADSNHRYNTSDYRKIDPVLGTEEDFVRLAKKAERFGIRILLDGVFSHTGSDSVYFNKKGNYPGKGAYQGPDSPYYSWYHFIQFPDVYESWWGFDTLPEVNELDPGWQDFIMDHEDSVMRHWLKKGAAGYRLDVADELPDAVIQKMRDTIKEEDKENFLLGEVWEDATTKESYGKLRQYALGKGLDSVMNYPFRNAVVQFLLGRTTAQELADFLAGQALNYPKPMYYCLMNLLSSHDIERIRTVLGTGVDTSNMSREQQASFVILPEADKRGGELERLAIALQFVLPGMPSIYYGDEVGMHGLKDPFNRAPFRMLDQALQYFYRTLAKIRTQADALSVGHLSVFAVDEDTLGVLRFILDGQDAFGKPAENGAYLTLINRSDQEKKCVVDLYNLRKCVDEEQLGQLVNTNFERGACLITGNLAKVQDGLLEAQVFRKSAALYKLE